MTIASSTDFLEARATAIADLAEVLRLTGRPDEAAARAEEALRLHGAKGNIVAAGRLRARIAAL